MLPGGIAVLGLYLFAPEAAFSGVAGQLCSVLAEVQKDAQVSGHAWMPVANVLGRDCPAPAAAHPHPPPPSCSHHTWAAAAPGRGPAAAAGAARRGAGARPPPPPPPAPAGGAAGAPPPPTAGGAQCNASYALHTAADRLQGPQSVWPRALRHA